MAALAAREHLRVLNPEFETRPRVFYKNLGRFDQCFIGGSVVAELAGVEDCVEGAEVVLSQSGQEIARQTTDVFGDFKFDGLEPDSGQYTVEVRHADVGAATVEGQVGESCYLGSIALA